MAITREGTNVTGERLVVIVLLIAIAYTTATMQGYNCRQREGGTLITPQITRRSRQITQEGSALSLDKTSGIKIKQMGIQKYIGRVKETGRIERRHSSFYIGLYGQNWVNFVEQCADAVVELMRLAPNKRKYYQKGLRAMELILSAL